MLILKRKFGTISAIKKLETIEEFLVTYKKNLQSRIEKDKKNIEATEELINYVSVHKKECSLKENAFNEEEVINFISKRLDLGMNKRSSLALSIQNLQFSSFENQELLRFLIDMKHKVENRILLDKKPEKFDREYGHGFFFSFERWREIKRLKLYKDLNKTKDEIQKNIEILQELTGEKDENSLLKRKSIEEFVTTLANDQEYFLSTKTIRKFDVHPYFHNKDIKKPAL